MSRVCSRCGLTLLGHIAHESWEECGPALRGHYLALQRRHAVAVRRGDGKAQGMERWRTRAQIAEARVKELLRGDTPAARIERLERRIAGIERRKAA